MEEYTEISEHIENWGCEKPEFTEPIIFKKIEEYLIVINTLEVKSDKVAITIELFNVLLDIEVINKFINKHLQFKKAIFEKALEFRKEKEFPELVEICERFIRKLGYDKNTNM